jgi:hypothetical protein
LDVYSYISTSCGWFLRVNLARLPRLVVLALLSLPVAGCVGPNDGLIGGRLSWFQYVSGHDMARSCARSSLERYRLIFNAEYTKQVRTYDILQNGAGARLNARVFRGSVTVDAAFSSAVQGLVGRGGARELDGPDYAAFKRTIASAEPYLGDEPVFLRSDSYYWVVLKCDAGRLVARAFTGPPAALEGLAFRRFLLDRDPTGVPVRVQRPVPADELTCFGRVYSAIEAETVDRAEGRGGPLFQFRYQDGQVGVLGG